VPRLRRWIRGGVAERIPVRSCSRSNRQHRPRVIRPATISSPPPRLSANRAVSAESRTSTSPLRALFVLGCATEGVHGQNGDGPGRERLTWCPRVFWRVWGACRLFGRSGQRLDRLQSVTDRAPVVAARMMAPEAGSSTSSLTRRWISSVTSVPDCQPRQVLRTMSACRSVAASR
jgi:hypothetical protein